MESTIGLYKTECITPAVHGRNWSGLREVEREQVEAEVLVHRDALAGDEVAIGIGEEWRRARALLHRFSH